MIINQLFDHIEIRRYEMNKQVLIEKVKSIESFNSSYAKDFAWGFDECRNGVLSLIQALDEPQKVKVPAFVAEWFEENKHNLNFAIYELCEAGKVPVDLYEGLTDFERWFYLNHDIDTLIRMQDGYEVEEEPEWVVKRGLFYFEEFDSQMNGDKFGFNGDRRLAKAHHFSDKSKAEAVADLIGGEVKKTKNDVSDSGPFKKRVRSGNRSYRGGNNE